MFKSFTLKKAMFLVATLFLVVIMTIIGLELFKNKSGNLPIYVKIYDSETEIYSYSYNGDKSQKNANRIEVPAEWKGLAVTEIGARAFQNFKIESVFLPSTIKIIHDYAFLGCTMLGAIEIPVNVEEIKFAAFKGCTSLASVAFETNKIEKIDGDTFQNCIDLEYIAIPASVNTIGSRAFAGCTALETIKIMRTASVIIIVNDTFQGCINIDEILVPNPTVQGQYIASPMWAWAIDPNLIWVG